MCHLLLVNVFVVVEEELLGLPENILFGDFWRCKTIKTDFAAITDLFAAFERLEKRKLIKLVK